MNEDNAPSFRQAPRNTGAACVWVLLVACLSAPAWAGGQSAAGFVLYEGLKEQFTLELPQGWHVFNQSGSPEYGVVVFSALSMRIPAEGMDEAALGAKMRKQMAQVDSGELPSFFVDRYPVKRGMSCDDLSKKARKKMLRVLTRATAFGKGSKLLNRPEAEPISLGGCQGLKVLVRAQTAEGREFVMLIYTVSHGQTTYDFALRNRKEYFEKNRPVFEKALSTLKITKGTMQADATPSQPATVTPTPPPTKKVVTPTVAKAAPAATTPGTVTLVGGTTVPIELTENINTKYNTTGALVYLRVTEDIKVGNKVAIPKGALVKAKIGGIAKRGMMGKAGGLTFHPVAVAALDGQWISLDREDFGAGGGGASIGGIVGMGLFAKGAAGYVLRGTEYEVTVRRDAVIDTGKRKPLASLRKADFQTSAKFQAVKKKIKFARGKPGMDFVLDVTLTQDITSLVQQKPSAIEIVEILDHVLRKPIKPINVVLDPKKNNFISATFDWWSLVKYAQPGKTPMTVQLKLSDGRLAQAEATLETEWKLK